MAELVDTRATLHSNGGSRPIPDPTEKTLDVVQREISALRELLEARLEGQRQIVETRLTDMDAAVRLVRLTMDGRPMMMDEKVAHLAEVHGQKFLTVDEKFHGVNAALLAQKEQAEKQFEERDQRVRDSRTSDAAALAAALSAAKEAVSEANKAFSLSIDKSEKATGEQIKQGAVVADTNFRAITDKIEAIDKRVTRSEGQGQGQGQLWGYIVGGVGLVGAVIAIFITLATRVP